jgi:hypothetical protein
MKNLVTSCALFLLSLTAFAQGSTEYGGGLKVSLNEDGSKYFRLITWHQAWLTGADNSAGDFTVTPSLRRSRMLMYAQINKRFLILTHFGLNSLNANNMHPVGKSASAAVFMHDAWAEYTIVEKKLHMGGGLHYWNGISRLTNQSTLNILTLDAPRFNWATIGTSDQFARHMGVYAKGKLGKLDYRVSFNNPISQSLDQIAGIAPDTNVATYRTRGIYNDTKGMYAFQGYVNYQFLDQESNLLPYMVGSYLGTKKVFNIGAGFFTHPNGTVSLNTAGDTITNNVNLFSADVFYDTPIGEKGASFNIYGVYYNYDFGPNYQLSGTSDVIATSQIFYVQSGFTLPEFSTKGKLQPYVCASYRDIKALPDAATTVGVGANWFLSGHNAKLTAEYSRSDRGNVGKNTFNIQAMIYL